jgi:hypothetical protein
MAIILDGTSGVTTPGVTNTGNETVAGNETITGSLSTPNTFGFKNRIINGGMVIDQRYAGAAGSAATNTAPYGVDRWQVYGVVNSKFTYQQNAGSVTPPAGFSNYFGITSSSAYTPAASERFLVDQNIEGFNWYDMAYGTANAKTSTLSFWVYSSLTGSFGGSLQNYAGTRSYPFSYTISSANTWTQISITIPGDTSGTWVGASNAGSLIVTFSLGCGSNYQGTANAWASANYLQPSGTVNVVGTNGATFYITGVQLEKGSTATSFDYRPYGTELQLCQRYYQKCFSQNYKPANGFSSDGVFFNGTLGWTSYSTTAFRLVATPFAVTMRTAPSMTAYSSAQATSAGNWCRYNGGWSDVTGLSFYVQDNYYSASATSTGAANQSYLFSGGWTADAEL